MLSRNVFSVVRPFAGRAFSTVRYTKSHEWVKLDGDVATVGITDHAQSALGDIVFVELPDIGDAFEAGDEFGSLESVKAASDLYSPVAGEVVEVNSTLDDEPSVVNTSATEDGWMVKLKTDGTLGDSLLDQEQYDALVKEEEAH